MAHPHSTHILLIDEDRSVLSVMNDIFTDEGYLVTCAATVRERDRLCVGTLSPDVIITDSLGQFTLDAVGSLAWWHGDAQLAQIPLVLCTGATHQVTLAEDALTEMGVRVLLKPFDIDDLLAITTSTLARES